MMKLRYISVVRAVAEPAWTILKSAAIVAMGWVDRPDRARVVALLSVGHEERQHEEGNNNEVLHENAQRGRPRLARESPLLPRICAHR
jgi:hypothetical protein